MSPVSSGRLHCDNTWPGVWIPMGLLPMFRMETYEIITKNIKLSTLLQNHPHHVYTS
jgi:hypothetical protein